MTYSCHCWRPMTKACWTKNNYVGKVLHEGLALSRDRAKAATWSLPKVWVGSRLANRMTKLQLFLRHVFLQILFASTFFSSLQCQVKMTKQLFLAAVSSKLTISLLPFLDKFHQLARMTKLRCSFIMIRLEFESLIWIWFLTRGPWCFNLDTRDCCYSTLYTWGAYLEGVLHNNIRWTIPVQRCLHIV